jgi:hypothetical protein
MCAASTFAQAVATTERSHASANPETRCEEFERKSRGVANGGNLMGKSTAEEAFH